MSAVVRAEDCVSTSTSNSNGDVLGYMSVALVGLMVLQLALTLLLNMCYGSVFILFVHLIFPPYSGLTE